MAHHHAPNQPRDEGKEPDSSHEIQKGNKVTPSHENKKSFLDYEIAGLAWPLVFVMSIIVIGLLGMILKAMGVF